MIDDFKQFLKFYRMYKKGKEMEQTMIDKIKNWVDGHKVELAVAAAWGLGYKIGFKRGCKATDRAVSRLICELDRVASKVVGR